MFFFFSLVFLLYFFLISKSLHLLNFLIGVEMIVISFLMMMMFNKVMYVFFFMPLLFLAFSVCESITGLVLFIWLIRVYSKDYLFMMNVLKF